MTDDERARERWELGTKRLSEGLVAEAVELFEQSIAVKPTAEGHTFRGWALSYLGRLDEFRTTSSTLAFWLARA